jgi:hypothetical protein
MILCDQEIRQLCLTADLVTPFNPDLINPASIDVRLGDTLLIESAQSRELVVYPLDRHSEEIPPALATTALAWYENRPDGLPSYVRPSLAVLRADWSLQRPCHRSRKQGLNDV